MHIPLSHGLTDRKPILLKQITTYEYVRSENVSEVKGLKGLQKQV